MKRTAAFILALVLALTLVACGNGGGGGTAAPSASPAGSQPASSGAPDASVPEAGGIDIGTGQGGNISFWHTQTGVNGQILEELIAEFNEGPGKEKNITVSSVVQESVSAKLTSVMAANDIANAPDVLLSSGLDACLYRDLDLTVWAEDLMAATGDFSRADLQPNSAEATSSMGRMTGVPFSNSAIMLYYNKDMFREAGLDPEKPPATIAELADYTEKLTVTSGGEVTRHGLAVTIERYQLANWIGGQGEYSFLGNNEGGRNGNFTEVVFGTEGTMEKFLTEYDKVVKSGGLQANADKPREEFIAGQYAMVIQSSSRINQFLEMSDGTFELGAATLPKVSESDTGGIAIGGGGLYILDRGDPEVIGAAWEFVKYMTSAEIQFKWHTSTGYIPTNAHTYEMAEMDAWLEENPMYQIPIEALKNSDPHVQEPLDPNPLELSAIYKRVVMEFIEGKLTVQEAVAEMETQCNDALDLYYRANPTS